MFFLCFAVTAIFAAIFLMIADSWDDDDFTEDLDDYEE